MRCDCTLGLDECNCCGRPADEPIPTQPADLDEERSRMGGLVTALALAFTLVACAFSFVTIFGPK